MSNDMGVAVDRGTTEHLGELQGRHLFASARKQAAGVELSGYWSRLGAAP